MNIFVFDIETVPDTDTGRKLYGLEGLSDQEVAQALFTIQNQATGTEFLPHYLQKIVCISVLLQTQDRLKVWSLGDESAGEAEIVQRFFEGIEKFTPTLVSWNGSGFDLPVLHYRGLLHGVVASQYWEVGDREQGFRWNNYLNRYHYRHLDLMDVLALYQPKAYASLDKISTLLGFPGKMGMEGGQVWQYYLADKQSEIRQYCERDVMNTYLIFLRFERMRGRLTPKAYTAACENFRTYLQQEAKPHFEQFLSCW